MVGPTEIACNCSATCGGMIFLALIAGYVIGTLISWRFK